MAEGPDGFYRQRDDLVGGQDTPWNVPAADFDLGEGLVTDTPDMRADDDNRFSGVLSQSDLAS